MNLKNITIIKIIFFFVAFLIAKGGYAQYEGASYDGYSDAGTTFDFPVKPTVVTNEPTSITGSSAVGNGNITDLGRINPTQHGVCWNTTGNPTTSDNHTTEGEATSTGAFTSNISDLSECTTYYVRAYATNMAGTSYGAQKVFTTLDETPPNIISAPSGYINLDADENCQAILPDFTGPNDVVASDNCDSDLEITQSPVSGTTVTGFENLITITVKDDAGNQSQATFYVSVIDNTPPVASFSDQTVDADNNCEASLPDYTKQINATDNCDNNVNLYQLPIASSTITGANNLVTINASDYSQNFTVVTFYVSVVDNTPPEITSNHTDKTFSANENCQIALPDYTGDVSATDNCDTDLDVTQSPTAGTLVAGTTSVTLTVTDDAGNSSGKSFNVTVEDNTAPEITSNHPEQTLDANENCQAALPDYTGDVTATDNCDTDLDVTQSPTAGTLVAGTTSVTLTVTDDAGNSSGKSFNVTVEDNTAPEITSNHPEQTLDANENCQAALPDYTGDVTATDNCDTDLSVTQTPEAGTLISGTDNTVFLTATDDAGNSVSTSFNIMVKDYTPAEVISAPANEILNANENCQAALPDYTGDVTATDNCDTDLYITQAPEPGTQFSGTNNVVTLEIWDYMENLTIFTFHVSVVDNTPLEITSTHNDQTLDANATCQASLPDYTGNVSATDNCDTDLNVSQSPAAGTLISGSDNLVTLTVTDVAGNSASTSFNVIVEDNIAPEIIFAPTNEILDANAACQASLPDYTGDVSVTDNCDTDLNIMQNPEPGITISGANNTVTLTITDVAGNSVSTSFNVKVKDNTAPVITSAHQNQIISPVSGCEAALPDYTGNVLATDNCDTDLDVAQTPVPGTTISGSDNTVTLTVTDDEGNSSDVSFNVAIEDDIPPEIIFAPTDQTLDVDKHCRASLPDYTDDVSVTDNCDTNLEITQNPVAGTLISETTSVILTVTDGSGNASETSFNVTVEDNISPEITSTHVDHKIEADINCQASLPDYTVNVTATDNCDGDLDVTQNPEAGILISGTTNVTLTVTDDSGNTSETSFNVAVVDHINPQITSTHGDEPISANENYEAFLPNYIPELTATDNCSNFSDLVVTQEPEPGTLITQPVTEVVLTVTDQADNSNQVAFNAVISNPVAGIFSRVGAVTAISPIPVAVEFSEAINDFTLDDIQVQNGEPANLEEQSEAVYHFDIMVVNPGKIAVTIPAGAVTDNDDIGNFKATYSIEYQPENAFSFCSDSYSVPGDAPNALPGVWHESSGEMSITVPTYFNSQITEIGFGSHIIEWQHPYGTMQYTITNNKPQISAGSYLPNCIGSENLQATQAPAGGTGQWEILQGSPVIENSTLYNSFVSLSHGINALQWEVTYGTCSAIATTQIINDMVVTNAGEDAIVLCGDQYRLQAEIQTPYELGEWQVVSGGDAVEIRSPEMPDAIVKNLPNDTPVTLQWQVWNNQCTATDQVIVTSRTPVIEIAKQDVSEIGAHDGSIDLTITGNADFEYTYEWNTGQTTQDISNLIAGTYTVRITDNTNNCSMERTVIIKRPQPAGCDISVDFTAEVENKTVTLTNLTTGENITGYQWDFGNGEFSNSAEEVVSYTYANSGVYQISLMAYIKDGENIKCTDHVEKEVETAGVICHAKIGYYYESDNIVHFSNQSIGEIEISQWQVNSEPVSATDIDVYTFENGVHHVKLTVLGNEQCISDDEVTLRIGDENCLAQFAHYPDETGEYTVYFTDFSIGEIDNWYWDFGDGSFSTEANVSHEYQREGVYRVCLTVFNSSYQKQASVCKHIRVGAVGCLADFEYFVDHETKNVALRDRSIGGINQWYWTLGEGTTEVGQNIVQAYSDGLYEVCLHGTNTNTGCVSEKCKEILIGELPCKAQFSTFVVPETNTVTFFDESIGNITERYWNFGDGNTRTDSEREWVTYNYETPGYYPVEFSVRTEDGSCIDHTKKFIQVGSVPCIVDFSIIVDGQNVEFRNTAIGNPETFFWDFGDNTFSTEENPGHVYENPGLYDVKLIVTDVTGASCELTKEVQTGDIDCSAKFTAHINGTDNTIYFINKSLGNITNYEWQFGDGSMSNSQTPEHKYKASGYHTASLRVRNNFGCMDYYETVILVGNEGADCEAAFSYTINKEEREVSFSDKSKGKPQKYIWNFGDGTTSTAVNPVHQYTEYGIYNVCLNIENQSKIRNTRCQSILLLSDTEGEECFADFIYVLAANSRTVWVKDNSIGANQWTWDFGDGNIIKGEHGSHTYTQPDFYIIKLIAENTATGCRSLAFNTVNAGMGNSGLFANFGVEILESLDKARGYPIDCYGASFGQASSFKWSFGDGTVDSTSTTPNHVYDEPGTYEVCLTIVDAITKDTSTTCTEVEIVDTQSAINELLEKETIQLLNYPNPVNGNLDIIYNVPSDLMVDISIFELAGKKVGTLVSERHVAGRYTLKWNTTNVAPGMYLLQFTAGNHRIMRKIVVRE